MAYGAAQSPGEEKSRLILGQIASIRTRLNALALQQGLFGGLTFILCASVLIVAGAFNFGPLAFLLVGIGAAVTALAGTVRTAPVAWRVGARGERGAPIADRGPGPKGTVLPTVHAAPSGKASPL